MRFTGQAPLQVSIYELEKLRCHRCGKIFSAQAPPEVGPEKYDATAGSMLALLKYGSGLPFNRLQRLQGDLEIPVPASTQWEIVKEGAGKLQPAHDELIRQAAQGEVVFNDDTSVKILERMGLRAKQRAFEEAAREAGDKPRTGLFTSGIVAQCGEHRVALFFSATNMPARTCSTCCGSELRLSARRSRCVMPCPATSRRSSARCWRIAWRMPDVNSSRFTPLPGGVRLRPGSAGSGLPQ